MAAAVLGPLFVVYASWRIFPTLRQLRTADRIGLLQTKVWAPHAATIVIGVTFVITLLVAGRWAYTDVLADLALGMAKGLGVGSLLLVALFVGALVGGWSAGRCAASRSRPRSSFVVLRVVH